MNQVNMSTIKTYSVQKPNKISLENNGSMKKLENDVSSSSRQTLIETKMSSNSKEKSKENTVAGNLLKNETNKNSSDGLVNRNLLTKTTTIALNNDLKRSNLTTTNANANNSTNENKIQKLSPSNENSNNAKLRARNVAKKTTSPTQQLSSCGWCSENKSILNYVLPTLSGENLEFCSEMCIAEFRKAVKKGACKQCGNAIRSIVAPNREYCSTYCMNKSRPKNGNSNLLFYKH